MLSPFLKNPRYSTPRSNDVCSACTAASRCPEGADLSERLSHVVQHEIAHCFGISDERLREIDAY
ncbi:MAG: metallopeptidase family protein [Chloroflexi bacterium]|nr:metallopeptidase family protein [Chloroflexota bacterium]